MKLTQTRIWFIFLCTLFLATLTVPSTREAHVLCLRLVFPFRGKTFVQGQPSGCMLYSVPNVQFSEKYQAELRVNARRSPDDFALAWTTTADWSQLQFPRAQFWTNHALLEWGSLRRCLFEHRRETKPIIEEALKTVRFAESTDPDNGALWLGEALLFFSHSNDEAAITALQVAATQRNWSFGHDADFDYLCKLYQNAGLSRLDAIAQANLSTSEYVSVGIQQELWDHLTDLMANAVNSTNDSQFSKLFTLWVDLRKVNLSQPRSMLQNVFRSSGPSDGLIEAMRKRMGVEPETSSDYPTQRNFRQKIFHDFLALQKDQLIVSRFWGQADAAQTEKQLRKELRERASYRWEMSALMGVNLTGACTPIVLFLLFAVTLMHLPFWQFHKSGGIPGKWPMGVKFWSFAAISLGVSAALGARFLFVLGAFSMIGMFSGGGMNPLMQSVLASSIVCGLILTCWFVGWKYAKKVPDLKYVVIAFGYIYLLAIVAMAFCRSELVEALYWSL